MIEELSHITIILKDLDRTSSFLTSVFEAKEVYSIDESSTWINLFLKNRLLTTRQGLPKSVYDSGMKTKNTFLILMVILLMQRSVASTSPTQERMDNYIAAVDPILIQVSVALADN